MAAPSLGAPLHGSTQSAISIPFVVLASILIGVGILALVYWIITFDWLYFGGVLPSITGGLMLFHPKAGADRAGEPAAARTGAVARVDRTISVVKLGGSILTRKQKAERLRPKILARLAGEIAATREPIVLLHGAGSFGHPGAVRFQLARPPEGGVIPPERARGASIVSAEVRRLHLAVLRGLVDAGARPWSVPAATTAANDAGRCVALDPEPFREAIAAGFVPVSFGDVVPDRSWGRSILSADTIALELARALPVRRVIFVSDVPGVLEPGALPKNVVVPEVTRELLERLSERAGGPDVTGGIRGKARAMLEIARLGADAGLISGLKDGLLSRALRGETTSGSWVRAAST